MASPPSTEAAISESAGLPIRSLLSATLCAVIWHILILVFGFACFQSDPPLEKSQKSQEQAAGILAVEASPKVRAWYQWDAFWFVHLSRWGYVLETTPDGELGQSNIAFTPGLAIVAAALSETKLINPWAGLLVFNLIAASLATAAIGAISWKLTNSRTVMFWSIAIYTVWPWRFFMIAPYQEAAGAAFAFWAVLAFFSGHAIPGLVSAMLSSAFRLNAVGLFGGLLAGCFVELIRGHDRKLRLRQILVCSGALLGWALLLGYFQLKFGDASLGVRIQSTWGRQPPHLSGIVESLGAPFYHRMTGTELLDWLTAWAVFAMIPLVYRNYGLIWAASLAGLTVQALSTSRVLSFGRFALLAFPVFVLAGQLAARWPRIATILCAMCLIFQVFLAWRFGQGQFVG
jgi:hypothetical protein